VSAKELKSYARMAVASLIGCTFCLGLGYFQPRDVLGAYV
jgi:hypothetical protein